MVLVDKHGQHQLAAEDDTITTRMIFCLEIRSKNSFFKSYHCCQFYNPKCISHWMGFRLEKPSAESLEAGRSPALT